MNVTEQWAAECTINAARNQDDLYRQSFGARVKRRFERMADRARNGAARNVQDVQAYIVREPTKAILVAAVAGGALGSLMKWRAG